MKIPFSPKFSIILPIFNETGNITELYSRLQKVMDTTGEPWEIVCVDDGSTDGSTEMLRELAKRDSRVRPVIFSRNFGHQIAVTAGLDYSRGQAVIIIDADLQDPPEVIPDLIRKWYDGYEVVYAVRTVRKGESWFKLITAALFCRFIYRITEIKIPVDTGDFRLLDRKVVDVINLMRERHRFLRGLSAWTGFSQAGVEYCREARLAGVTKYPLKKMFKFAGDAITGFSFLPLKLAFYAGLTSISLAIMAIPIWAMKPPLGNSLLSGQALTLIVILFLGGVQLVCTGILGEYLGRLFDQEKGRPLYIVRNEPED